jgi:hypothetical protein
MNACLVLILTGHLRTKNNELVRVQIPKNSVLVSYFFGLLLFIIFISISIRLRIEIFPANDNIPVALGIFKVRFLKVENLLFQILQTFD